MNTHCVHERIDRGGGDYRDVWYCAKGHECEADYVCLKCGYEHGCPDDCPDREMEG
jgi:hypothetical protein